MEWNDWSVEMTTIENLIVQFFSYPLKEIISFNHDLIDPPDEFTANNSAPGLMNATISADYSLTLF